MSIRQVSVTTPKLWQADWVSPCLANAARGAWGTWGQWRHACVRLSPTRRHQIGRTGGATCRPQRHGRRCHGHESLQRDVQPTQRNNSHRRRSSAPSRRSGSADRSPDRFGEGVSCRFGSGCGLHGMRRRARNRNGHGNKSFRQRRGESLFDRRPVTVSRCHIAAPAGRRRRWLPGVMC